MRRSNWTIFRYALQVAVLVAMSVPTKPLLADTTLDSGTTTVSTGTNFGTRLYVASTGTATMNVVAGGYATDSIGYLGYSADSLGFATVSSGTWAHSLALFVGNNGAGVLTMSDGKITCGTQGFVGTNPGSNGRAIGCPDVRVGIRGTALHRRGLATAGGHRP